MTDTAIEAEIQAKGLTAPRVTPAHIESQIVAEHYHVAGDSYDGPNGFARIALGCLTICVLVLRNGFTVTGESACASPENFDAELGRKIARQNAVAKIWPLEGYLLRHQLSAGPSPQA
jgi:hypothetical protein